MINDAEKVGANQLYICDLKYSLSSSFAPRESFIKFGKEISKEAICLVLQTCILVAGEGFYRQHGK